ncbi:unnamed protein product [Rangifer tarandus platyrhynchus]|uniref:Uncharacterized protein n=1 Tax=Rangifer tarandus platyrhynchus TaxID=3082113 RepID=A0AC59ZZ91_RANTA
MPSAAGLLLQYRPRRLSPGPWPAAGLCSALAAFTPGAPPNRLLRLLICLKSNRTSRRRSPPGAGEAGPGVCAPRSGGGAGAARGAAGPFVPGPGRRGGRRGARGSRGAGGRGARALAACRPGPESPIPAECREERVSRERGFCLFITQSFLSGSVKNHFQTRKWREGFLREDFLSPRK